MPNLTDFTLRRLEKSDLSTILKWRNSDRIKDNMYTDHIISWEEHQLWHKKIVKSMKNVFLVFEYKCISTGLVYFTDIDNYNGTCFWGFYMGDFYGPKGSGIIMGYLGIEYAINHLNIRKLCGETFAFNIKGEKFHEKLGFQKEGYFKKQVFKKGQYQDIIRFGLFDNEWQEYKVCLKKEMISICQ